MFKVVIITQPEDFFLPNAVRAIGESDLLEVQACFLIDDKNSLANNKIWFLQGFGVLAALKMGFRKSMFKVFDLAYRYFGFKKLKRFASFTSVGKVLEFTVENLLDVNSHNFKSRLASLEPDVVVSFSAPTVFDADVLSIPRFGCLNLHCSLIPDYCGVMPSFWVLFHGESIGGCSVHVMDDRIDNGALLAQAEVPILNKARMYDVIRDTKQAGGALMLEVLEKLAKDRVVPPSIDYDPSKRRYFSWPKTADLRQFRRAGGRLI